MAARGGAGGGGTGRYTGAVPGHALTRFVNPGDARDTSATATLARSLRALEPALNHFIVTRYDDHTQHMPTHSDKTGDMAAGAYIYDVSLGAARRLLFETRAEARGEAKGEARGAAPRLVHTSGPEWANRSTGGLWIPG